MQREQWQFDYTAVRLAEAARAKIAYHTELRDTYDGWRQVLEANPENRLSLDIDDWLFFFGRDTGRDD